jgi:hypothetical protein
VRTRSTYFPVTTSTRNFALLDELQHHRLDAVFHCGVLEGIVLLLLGGRSCGFNLHFNSSQPVGCAELHLRSYSDPASGLDLQY